MDKERAEALIKDTRELLVWFGGEAGSIDTRLADGDRLREKARYLCNELERRL